MDIATIGIAQMEEVSVALIILTLQQYYDFIENLASCLEEKAEAIDVRFLTLLSVTGYKNDMSTGIMIPITLLFNVLSLCWFNSNYYCKAITITMIRNSKSSNNKRREQ